MVLKWSRVIFRKSKIYKHSILPPRGSKKAFPTFRVLKTPPTPNPKLVKAEAKALKMCK